MAIPIRENRLVLASSQEISRVFVTTYLEPDGDLRLRVGPDTEYKDFVVCSRVMGRSSPIWKKMLFGGFKESKPPEGEWIVPLPDDLPDALLTVLNIVHGKFTEVATEMSIEQLYAVLELTDKYDMIQKLQPWASAWSSLLLLGNPREFALERIFAAWELGQQDIFCFLMTDMAMVATMDDHGHLTAEDGRIIGNCGCLGPTDIAGKFILQLTVPIYLRESLSLICFAYREDLRSSKKDHPVSARPIE